MNKETFAQRAREFAIRCARLVRSLAKNDVVASEYGRQLLRSSASVASNYRAANRGRSRSEFIAKLGIVEEEADESVHWLDMLVATDCVKSERVTELRNEGNELLAMTVASINTARKNEKSGKPTNPKSEIRNSK